MPALGLSPPKKIHYPESDGQPMAENTLQYEWIVTIKGNLDVLFADRDDVFVAGDLFWYPVQGEPGIRQAPDTLVVFGPRSIDPLTSNGKRTASRRKWCGRFCRRAIAAPARWNGSSSSTNAMVLKNTTSTTRSSAMSPVGFARTAA